MITNSGIYKSTRGGTVIQNIYLPVQVAQNIICAITVSCWALTINETKGLTLSKACIDIGQSERTAGVCLIAYVAISRAKTLASCVIEPITCIQNVDYPA